MLVDFIFNIYSDTPFRFQFEISEANNFFGNSTIAVVPDNEGTKKLVEMLRQDLPNVEFLYYQVERIFSFFFFYSLTP